MKNILGQIAVVCIMIGIVYVMFASFGGEPDYSNQQDPCDGSARSICP